MAKYTVKFSCGHSEERELVGKVSERERKIAYWQEKGVCTACYREIKAIEMATKYDEVEMLYREYKNGEYSDCSTKPGSYNGTTKTIIVYVPKH